MCLVKINIETILIGHGIKVLESTWCDSSVKCLNQFDAFNLDTIQVPAYC